MFWAFLCPMLNVFISQLFGVLSERMAYRIFGVTAREVLEIKCFLESDY